MVGNHQTQRAPSRGDGPQQRAGEIRRPRSHHLRVTPPAVWSLPIRTLMPFATNVDHQLCNYDEMGRAGLSGSTVEITTDPAGSILSRLRTKHRSKAQTATRQPFWTNLHAVIKTHTSATMSWICRRPRCQGQIDVPVLQHLSIYSPTH